MSLVGSWVQREAEDRCAEREQTALICARPASTRDCMIARWTASLDFVSLPLVACRQFTEISNRPELIDVAAHL